MRTIFADIESTGAAPTARDAHGNFCVMTEFALVDYSTKESFHGVLVHDADPGPENPALPVIRPYSTSSDPLQVARAAEQFLGDDRIIMVSDNPGFDAMWLNCFFHQHLGYSPLGYSSRRIGDFFAGLSGNWRKSSNWKSLRKTSHTHNPVDDCMGNIEAVACAVADLGVTGLPEITWDLGPHKDAHTVL